MTTIANKLPATTAIGSLPHHNIDVALGFSFQTRIPFLPQIPIRNPWEYMIAQALEGMPGLQVERDGSAILDLDVWLGRSHAFNEKLLSAFSASARSNAFEAFEPSSASSSSWQPFLWELEERGIKLAKIQLAGPMTAQWSLPLKDGSDSDRHSEISSQIYRLVLARAIAMIRRLFAIGVQPLLYLDEPGLSVFNQSNPKHVMGLQELKIMIQTLRKEKTWVGLHCCSNTDWPAVLGLGLDVLSIDSGLSLEHLLKHASLVESFLQDGGRLSLGVIPTATQAQGLVLPKAAEIFESLMSALRQGFPKKPELVDKILKESIYTPACGLALLSTSEAEAILSTLLEFQEHAERALAR